VNTVVDRRVNISEQQEQRIYAALYAGRKIEAIKLHREATGWGLKESKDFIEALERQLRGETPEKFTAPPSKSGCSVSIATVMVFALGAMWLASGGQ
jgi:ribosomal protein L7/L12